MPSGTTPLPSPRVGRVEHEARQDRRPRPQDQHAAALAVTEAHQAMVEVVLVGGGDARAAAWPGG